MWLVVLWQVVEIFHSPFSIKTVCYYVVSICNSIILTQYVRQMQSLDSLVGRQTNTNMSNNKSNRTQIICPTLFLKSFQQVSVEVIEFDSLGESNQILHLRQEVEKEIFLII